jgi:hypothetical protein
MSALSMTRRSRSAPARSYLARGAARARPPSREPSSSSSRAASRGPERRRDGRCRPKRPSGADGRAPETSDPARRRASLLVRLFDGPFCGRRPQVSRRGASAGPLLERRTASRRKFLGRTRRQPQLRSWTRTTSAARPGRTLKSSTGC